MSLAASAAAAKIADINEMLRLCGQRPIPALDTGGTSPAAEAERYIDDAREQILSRGWHCNTEYVDLEIDGDDHFVAPAGTLVIDTRGPHERYNVVLRDGNLYSLDKNTFDWSVAAPGLETMKVRVVLSIDHARMTPGLRRAVLTEAALQYTRGVLRRAGTTEDVRLSQAAIAAFSEAQAEESRQRDTNILDTDHAQAVRGYRRAWRRRN